MKDRVWIVSDICKDRFQNRAVGKGTIIRATRSVYQAETFTLGLTANEALSYVRSLFQSIEGVHI